MVQRIIYKKTFNADGAVFIPVVGRFIPRFGKDSRVSRDIYRDIANCRGCKGGMTENFVCRVHKEQSGMAR
jgi:hypothetical protein